jgi:hypothetical protein
VSVIRHSLVASLALLAATGPAVVWGDSTVEGWELTVTVCEYPGSDRDTWSFTADPNSPPLSPFQDSHLAALGDSNARGSYDFTWGEAFGRFLIEGSQQAQQIGENLLSFSMGEIEFRPLVDSSYSLEASYSYVLPELNMMAYFQVALQDNSTTPPTTIFNDPDFGETINQAPKSGTIGRLEAGTLFAGHQYSLTYMMRLSTNGPSGLPATGTGKVDFAFQVLPEPATSALCVLALFAVWSRRHCG